MYVRVRMIYKWATETKKPVEMLATASLAIQ